MAVHRDFGVKNGFWGGKWPWKGTFGLKMCFFGRPKLFFGLKMGFGGNGHAKRHFGLKWGFGEKWPCKGIFGLKMGFGRK